MEKKIAYAECVSILKRELHQTAEIAALQAIIKKSVRQRQWTNFDLMMKTLKKIGSDFEKIDKNRMDILDNTYFYRLSLGFKPEERDILNDLYRKLKLEALRIRLENDSLLAYINESASLAEDFLKKVYPAAKGRIYGRNGTMAAPELHALEMKI
ncbi:MAG: hypothetical protein LBM77_01735 [Spirochaetaceae bacterium]|jgi:hypothetical protein|nr:hypothetical protein [Spirochaetaceae bacterium]